MKTSQTKYIDNEREPGLQNYIETGDPHTRRAYKEDRNRIETTNKAQHSQSIYVVNGRLVRAESYEKACAISPTLQDHIRDLHDATTRFEDRAKRAEAHADKLAEALRDCITEQGAMSDRSHYNAKRRLAYISDLAKTTLAAYEAAQ